jgi:hypothetical protein
MAEYTFHSLSDADFEDLSCDLLGAALKTSFQRFTKGPDSGIDLLRGARMKGGIVVQCKHYSGSKFAALKSKLAADELPKIAKLAPRRFILATSLGLTPKNKEELYQILAPHCRGLHDIYGRDDLNSLLREYPKIETTHYKLWLTSTAVLQRVLRHGATLWNAMTKEDIERKMSLYVQTGAYRVASDILHEQHCCLLSGIPGIGKTTLAQVLVTRLLDQGYELVSVRDDIQEALDACDPLNRQVIYYDDFLGQSSITERLGKNEDRSIVRLITEARRSEHLRVVLTTREYILEDAKRIYEPLNSGDLDLVKCIVKVEDYTRGHRARILYNHVYFSGLPLSYAQNLLTDRSYRRIIDHPGYSPRIVEWMTIGGGTQGVQPEHYVARFVEVLDNPTRVWEHAFESQLGDNSRAILFCLGTVEGWVGLEELQVAWMRLRKGVDDATLSIEERRAFNVGMKQLDGSFIRTLRIRDTTVVEFHNPSIKDYVRKRIAADADLRAALVRSAVFFEQLWCLVRLSLDGHIVYQPNLMVVDVDNLHEVIRRTISAKSATYQIMQHGRHRVRDFFRTHRDVGNRLSIVAGWDKLAPSKGLLALCAKIAGEMISAGEIASAATLDACDFLQAVVHSTPNEERTSVVNDMLAQFETSLSTTPSLGDWETWTKFYTKNLHLFEEGERAKWAELAQQFCGEEFDAIVQNAESSSAAQEWYDNLREFSAEWGIRLDEDERFDELMVELQGREDFEADSRREWAGSDFADDPEGDNKHIDRLFDSLRERV